MRKRQPPAMTATQPIRVDLAFKFAEERSSPIQCTGCWRCAPERFERPVKRGKNSKGKKDDR